MIGCVGRFGVRLQFSNADGPDPSSNVIEPASTWRHCPDCGGDVQAVRRLRAGRGSSDTPGRLRYRCANEACGWREPRTRGQRMPADGLATPVTPKVRAWLATIRPPARTAAVGLVVAFSVMAPLAVVALIGVGAMAGRHVALGVAPGESHDGAPLQGGARGGPVGGAMLLAVAQAPASPMPAGPETHGLTLRRGCQWGQPGRNPYRGTMAQALQAAQLPAEVVQAIVAQQQAGQKAGRVSISREAIRHTTDGREFDPGAVALTFGRTLCLDTRVNFAPGHQELADYYEARDDQGRLHSVMVPDVCGNVSVLGARGERGVVASMAATLAQRSEALAHLADSLADPEGHPTDDATSAGAAGAAGTRSGADGESHAGGAEGGAAAAGAGGVDGVGASPSSGGTHSAVGAPGAHHTAGAAAAGSSTVARSTGSIAGHRLAVGPPAAAPGASGAPAPTVGPGIVQVTDRAPTRGPGSPVLTALGRITERVVPRTVAAAAVGTLAKVLAQRSNEVAGLAKLLGDKGPSTTGSADNTQHTPMEVPEPGTLVVVLLGLAALVVQRWRRRARG